MLNKILVSGVFTKKPHIKAPDFVIAKVSIKVEDFAPFVKKYVKNGWLNLEILESQKGIYYTILDDFEPNKKNELQAQNNKPEDLPF